MSHNLPAHTPAPWSAEDTADGHTMTIWGPRQGGAPRFVAEVPLDGTRSWDDDEPAPSQARSDAALIAAAPTVHALALIVCRLNVDRGIGTGLRPGTDEAFQNALTDLWDALNTPT